MLTFSLLIVFANQIIPPDGRDFHQRLDRRGYRVQLRAFDVIPANRSLKQTPALLLGDEEYFRIETEPVNPLQAEDRSSGLSSKRFEPALSIFESQAGEYELDQVGPPTDVLTKRRLMSPDQTAVNRARAEDDIVIVLGDRLDDFDDLAGRCRQVGVIKKSDFARGLKHSISHGVALAAIPRILDQSKPGAGAILEITNRFSSMVC